MKQILLPFCILFFLSVSHQSQSQTKTLFNGKDLKGWHIDVPDMDKNPALKTPFLVRNGLLVSLGTPGGHLITDDQYENFRFTFQYRFAGKPGNCGALVFVSTPRALYEMFPKSIEVQLMNQNAGDFWCIQEDITVPDMEKRRGPKEKWGVNGDKLRRVPNLTDGTEKPLGEWNSMTIECVKNSIKVWLNGVMVNYGYNATAQKGQIALQSEGSEVEFKEVKVASIKSFSK
ncbi:MULTISPECIES: 3-keto-disaccharide hydrolase [Dyadobacter]|uniref:DUF1080 domain-containing protein n=1 Tax=Dyadobacter chenhuakuii TaxID=2909339 RepID=A0ABY4XNV7_9BACT|nr:MULTISPECIES: DUF1080 domain-containing protein [Dyadobacter]MCE7072349.1 DUF1080 domain-containing protein [Dyadobacter sp. CY327]MCF2494603.1 DUF1080 domain-containing protein [Dyadobacter chenhuakuii]USJ32075.1 DUF1080 domain-containing protein [Dyadobacter chenhuakuii]